MIIIYMIIIQILKTIISPENGNRYRIEQTVFINIEVCSLNIP